VNAASSSALKPVINSSELPLEPCDKCGAETRPWNLTLVQGRRLCPQCLAASKRGSLITLAAILGVALLVIAAVGYALVQRSQYLASPEPSLALVRSAAARKNEAVLDKYVADGWTDDVFDAMKGRPRPSSASALGQAAVGAFGAAYGLQSALETAELRDYGETTGTATGLAPNVSKGAWFTVEFELMKLGTGSDAIWQITRVRNAVQYVDWIGSSG
jgi:hypothetical protein